MGASAKVSLHGNPGVLLLQIAGRRFPWKEKCCRLLLAILQFVPRTGQRESRGDRISGSERREIPCSKIAFTGNSLTFLKVGNINSLIRPKIYYLTFTTSKKRTILLVLKTVLFFCPCGKAHEGSTKKKKSFSRWDIPNSFFVAVGGKSRRRCPLVKYSPLGGKTNAESPII